MGNLFNSYQASGDDAGPVIWLLVCAECKRIDELPVDDLQLLQIHTDNHHTDPTPQGVHVAKGLYRVPVQHWATPATQREIKRQMFGGADGLDAVDGEFYDSRSTFYEDAMTCYKKHLRPKGQCPDWLSDSKRLIPNTAKDRKELGLAKPAETGPVVHLCRFCPVSTYNATKARTEAGAYE